MANVDQIARETAAAIVEHITGKPADTAAIAGAIAKLKAKADGKSGYRFFAPIPLYF